MSLNPVAITLLDVDRAGRRACSVNRVSTLDLNSATLGPKPYIPI